MAQPPSDALVVFGVTGDLAFKQIFPALQALVRRGQLNVPILGVARSDYNLDQLRARARQSVERRTAMLATRSGSSNARSRRASARSPHSRPASRS